MMIRTPYTLALILMSVVVSHAQQPFSTFEKAVKDERGGWAGNQEHLSTVFDAERRRLGDRFETELLKWLGNDPEKHYWISYFLESESYLHGNKPLPHLSLLVKQQGLVLVRDKDDEESQRYVVGLSFTAAILSSELRFPHWLVHTRMKQKAFYCGSPNLNPRSPHHLNLIFGGMTESNQQSDARYQWWSLTPILRRRLRSPQEFLTVGP